MHWRKLGLIYGPTGAWWARSHAYLPTAEALPGGEVIRVYFAGWDEHNRGRIGFADLDAADPTKVLGATKEPLLDLGEPGCFDDSGVVPSCVVHLKGEKYLYYIGFQLTRPVPYMLFTGLAKFGPHGETLQRVSRTPVLDRTHEEPFSRSAPFVLQENGGCRMWYWTCLHWTMDGDKPHYNNVIRHLQSADGLHWPARGEDCIVPDFQQEYAAGRPWVIRRDDGWHMWYSLRAHDRPYVIQYAFSPDGVTWQRRDDGALSLSSEGWDSDMTCFPSLVQAGGNTYMFYNGNGHGRDGFGCAVLEN